MNSTPELTLTVVVPTYMRADDLERCLHAIANQQRKPDEVIVVVRNDDGAAQALLEAMRSTIAVKKVEVRVPGQVAALNAALGEVTTDIVSFTDDDAAPWPDWTARILRHFAGDGNVAGVGGRDYMHVGGRLQDGRATYVGKVLRFSKHIGRHHLGHGEARPVDILKGANMSYRMRAVGTRRFDTRLRGTGAQVHNDLAFSLALRKAGFTLIYDPAVAVDHFLAQRFDEDQRFSFRPVAISNGVYNETLVRLEYAAAWERPLYLLWAVFIGTRHEPGLAKWLWLVPSGPKIATQRLLVTLRARYDAARDFRR